ncbi:hypothetical protein SAMN05421837_103594 [Amycolatopsis pretoriensis]|uniref:Squamosa promoter-binding protein 15 n=1 Tax=Amycolatopsis pretoriensis TaxID=218821 RepID=A0A1H5QMF2_9PSEU|nr:squamosa promoter-binding protein 15 [Amycolatopsis pretoriensis]SEF27024.1 hypothetical protein SAMN05421837_103594 [Amycolatopsis pretoriensis]
MSWVTNMMLSTSMEDWKAAEALSEWLRTEAPRRYDSAALGCGYLRELTGAEVNPWGGWKNPECRVWAGALNHADLSALLDRVQTLPWLAPHAVQVFLMDQEQLFFRVWMFRDGELRQYAPERPDEEDPAFGPPYHP